MMIDISVVVPLYNCEEFIEELCQRLTKTLESLVPSWEIILVDDGSPAGDWKMVVKQACQDCRIRGIRLSRNFGQHSAITAGLEQTRGNWIVVMDGDLQDQPEEITKFVEKSKEGFEVIVGRRTFRMAGMIKRGVSRLYYLVFNHLTGLDVDGRISSFGLYSRKVIHAVLQAREQVRSFGIMVKWAGFPRVEIDIQHAARSSGTSGYGFLRAFQLAMDTIISYSDRLLRLCTQVGFLMSIISLTYAAWLAFRYMVWSIPVLGWTSIIVSIYISTGLIVGSIGIMGLYIGKIFHEVKKRPIYLLQDMTFESESKA